MPNVAGRRISAAYGMRRGSARDYVYAHLRERIVGLDLVPGQAVSEKDMADQLGVSRTPVREAFIRLSHEGLVEIIPQLGSFISRIKVPDVLEAQFIREALERACLPEAIKVVDEAESARMCEMLEQQQAAVDRGDSNLFFMLDEEMHRYLIELGGHHVVWALAQSSKAHLDRARRLTVPDATVMNVALGQHRLILESVMSRSRKDADRHMRDHLRLILRYMDSLVEKLPELFDEQ